MVSEHRNGDTGQAAGRTDAMDALFRPRTVAIVGASADLTKTGGRPVQYLLAHGFKGTIYPVNPKVDEIAGLTCYPSVEALPTAPDMAIVLVGAARAPAAVRDLAQRGTKMAIVLAGGFAEAGEEGRVLQDELVSAAGNMRILGPNTIGAVDLHSGIVLSASGALEGKDLPAGGISVASQSGGILGALLSRGSARGIGFAKLAATGNELDIDLSDLIAFYAQDPETSVIAVYAEGIRSVEAFRRATGAARAAGKPVVVYKVGRSEAGARAAVSHTGAMAGEDRLYDALFRQCGVIRANSFSELLDIPAMLAAGRQMAGHRIAVLTSSGGAGSLIVDACGVAGLEVPLMDPATARRLADILGVDEPMTGNPVDVTLAGVKPEIMTAATQAILASPSVDGLVVVAGSSALAQPEIAVGAIRKGAQTSDKPILAYVSPEAPHIVRELNMNGVPAFTAPETCAVVFMAAQAPSPRVEAVPLCAPGPDAGLRSGTLDEWESRELLARFGVEGPRQMVVRDGEEAREAARALGDKVVLKVLSDSIAHKSDVGGVRVGLTQETIGPALTRMQSDLAANGFADVQRFLVQEMLSDGLELILGLRYDPQLGPFLLLGAGGVLAELLDDSTVRLLPLAPGEARQMVSDLRISRLLEGYRGAPARDVDALVEAIEGLSRMGVALGSRLQEAEINPLFVLPEGRGVAAADGLVVIA